MDARDQDGQTHSVEVPKNYIGDQLRLHHNLKHKLSPHGLLTKYRVQQTDLKLVVRIGTFMGIVWACGFMRYRIPKASNGP